MGAFSNNSDVRIKRRKSKTIKTHNEENTEGGKWEKGYQSGLKLHLDYVVFMFCKALLLRQMPPVQPTLSESVLQQFKSCLKQRSMSL